MARESKGNYDNGEYYVKEDDPKTNWALVTFIICATVLFILYAGTPDLMDAIIKRVAG